MSKTRILLGISSSPRKGGNSDILLDKLLDGAMSSGGLIEKVRLNELNFKPCQECGGCDDTGLCVIGDDMGLLYEKVRQADCLVLASPLFFTSISAQTKMMIDRFQCIWIAKHRLKKKFSPEKNRKGVFLCVSALDKIELFENAKKIIRSFFATLDIEYFGDIYCGGVDKMATILKNEAVLKKAFKLGADLARSIHSQREL